MTHIRKRTLPSGKTRWQTIWGVGSARRSEMFKTRREAVAKRIAVDTGRPRANSPFPVLAGKYLQSMESAVKNGQLTDAYYVAVERDVRLHVLPDQTFAGMRCTEIWTKECQELLLRLADRVGATRARAIRGTLRDLFSFGVAEGFLNTNPVTSTKIPRPARPTAKPTAPGSAIYFLQATGSLRIKIGFSNNPARRIRSLLSGCPEPTVLLGTTPGTMHDEKELHSRFHHLREKGEWFRAEPDLLSHIAKVIA